MYPVRLYVFEDATIPQILLSYATLERLGIISFQVPNLVGTHALDHVAVQTPPSSKRKTIEQVTFQDPISKTTGSHTSSNPPNSHCGKGKITVPKGEEALTPSLCKTINTNQEVKVGSSVLSKTLPSPNSLLTRPLGTPLWQMPPFLPLPSPFSTTLRCSHPW